LPALASFPTRRSSDLKTGSRAVPFRNAPPPAHSRQRVGEKIDLGVRTLNSFVTCCRGQRMGIFAGSGVGKSVLFSMLARNTSAEDRKSTRLNSSHVKI